MDWEERERLSKKKFKIGLNVGRKEVRDQLEQLLLSVAGGRYNSSKRDNSFQAGKEAGRKEERKRQAKERGRKKWYRRLVIITVATSVVVLKAIEVLMSRIYW